MLPSTVGVGWWAGSVVMAETSGMRQNEAAAPSSERGWCLPVLSKGAFCAWQNMSPSLSSPTSRRSGAGDLLLGPLPCLGVPDERIIFVLCRRHCFPNGS